MYSYGTFYNVTPLQERAFQLELFRRYGKPKDTFFHPSHPLHPSRSFGLGAKHEPPKYELGE